MGRHSDSSVWDTAMEAAQASSCACMAAKRAGSCLLTSCDSVGSATKLNRYLWGGGGGGWGAGGAGAKSVRVVS